MLPWAWPLSFACPPTFFVFWRVQYCANSIFCTLINCCCGFGRRFVGIHRSGTDREDSHVGQDPETVGLNIDFALKYAVH